MKTTLNLTELFPCKMSLFLLSFLFLNLVLTVFARKCFQCNDDEEPFKEHQFCKKLENVSPVDCAQFNPLGLNDSLCLVITKTDGRTERTCQSQTYLEIMMKAYDKTFSKNSCALNVIEKDMNITANFCWCDSDNCNNLELSKSALNKGQTVRNAGILMRVLMFVIIII